VAPDLEQFARDQADKVQVIGLGAQNNFADAQNFLGDIGVESLTMLWDPTFTTWQSFGTRINSEMVLMSSDLNAGTALFYGFGENERQQILDALPQLT
jgi:hypothetical protein